MAKKPSRLDETLPALCGEFCGRNHDRIAMQIRQGEGYRRLTYQQIGQQIEALSTALVEQEVRPGDRVAIVAENRPEWAIAYFGIVAAGATAVPLDIQMNKGELETFLAASKSRMIFATARTWPVIMDLPFRPALVSLDRANGAGNLTLEELVERGGKSRGARPMVAPDDVASLLYTSGTTGKPKGVLLTHRNLVSNARALAESGLAGAEDNFLAVLPLHHTYPFMVSLLVPLWLGARVTFLQSLKGPDLVQCLREAQVTFLVGVPQIFAMVRRAIFEEIGRRPPPVRLGAHGLLVLADVARERVGVNLGKLFFASIHQRFGTSLRLLCSGGARLDPEVARDLFRLGFTLLEGYGLTETAPVVTFNPIARPKIGSVGIPIPGVEVRIEKTEAEEFGEVMVRGANVMKGYDGNPEATAEAIHEGWFHTGVLGYLDRDSYLFLTGRTKELIVTAGGKNINPEELEARYQASPAIAELCLVGTESTREGGEELHAVVVPDFECLKALKVGDIRGHIKDELTRIGRTLSPYQRVAGLSVVKEPLPRTRLGKIQRYQVAAMLGERAQGLEEKSPLSPADQELLQTDTARAVLEALAPLVPGRGAIRLDDYLDLDLGLDSLRWLEWVAALEARYGPLPDSFADDIVTVREAIEKLAALVYAPAQGGVPGQRAWRDILDLEPSPVVRDALQFSPPVHHRAMVEVARFILRLVLRTVFRLRVSGLEHLPPEGPYLLAGNHVSHIDPFVVLASLPSGLFANCFTLGWQPYFSDVVSSWIARVSHIIPVGGDAPLVLTLQASAAVLRRKRILLIFPEGQRALDGRLQSFKRGVGVLACELGVPVLPVWIEGTFRVLPAGARWPQAHPIALRFGESVRMTSSQIDRWRQEERDPYKESAMLIREAVLRLGL